MAAAIEVDQGYPRLRMRPNVLWLVLDTARRDAFEPYGAAAGSTPAVADLARRGAAFSGVHSAGCWTVPSHAAMFTGLFPRAAGLSNVDKRPQDCRAPLAAQKDRLLPEVMRKAGYATAGVTANIWVSDRSGFSTGFEQWVSLDGGRQTGLASKALRARIGWARQALRADVDDGAAEAEQVMRGWIENLPARPFFWFANLIECHSPYLPPRPYNDLGALDRLRAAEEARRHLTLEAIWRACVGGFEVPDDALERMRHLYGRAVRSMDDVVERLLGALDAQGVLEDTLVIVTSDHGENFGEGGLMGHAFSLDERLTHVPFVAAGPGAEAFDGMRSLVELPRRVAKAVGVTAHPWHEELPGVAVGQFDALVSEGDPRAREAAEEWGLGEEAVRRLSTSFTTAIDGRWKLVRADDGEHVFDLEEDPLELRPLDPSTVNGALAPLRAALDHEAVVTVRSPEPARAEAASDDDADLEEQLRLLGYL